MLTTCSAPSVGKPAIQPSADPNASICNDRYATPLGFHSGSAFIAENAAIAPNTPNTASLPPTPRPVLASNAATANTPAVDEQTYTVRNDHVPSQASVSAPTVSSASAATRNCASP